MSPACHPFSDPQPYYYLSLPLPQILFFPKKRLQAPGLLGGLDRNLSRSSSEKWAPQMCPPHGYWQAFNKM